MKRKKMLNLRREEWKRQWIRKVLKGGDRADTWLGAWQPKLKIMWKGIYWWVWQEIFRNHTCICHYSLQPLFRLTLSHSNNINSTPYVMVFETLSTRYGFYKYTSYRNQKGRHGRSAGSQEKDMEAAIKRFKVFGSQILFWNVIFCIH